MKFIHRELRNRFAMKNKQKANQWRELSHPWPPLSTFLLMSFIVEAQSAPDLVHFHLINNFE